MKGVARSHDTPLSRVVQAGCYSAGREEASQDKSMTCGVSASKEGLEFKEPTTSWHQVSSRKMHRNIWHSRAGAASHGRSLRVIVLPWQTSRGLWSYVEEAHCIVSQMEQNTGSSVDAVIYNLSKAPFWLYSLVMKVSISTLANLICTVEFWLVTAYSTV